VRLAHFEAFRPLCVRCRGAGRGERALELRPLDTAGDDVVDGMLTCPGRECRFEYPILAGIPFLVADVRDHVARNAAELRAGDPSAYAESVIGDCLGPESDYARDRMYLSSYGLAHWPRGPEDLGLGPVLDAAFALAEEVRGRWLDLGCSLGRGSFELAARTGELVLGVDISLSMLKAARRIAVQGRLRHPVRKVGVVYERRDEVVDPPGRERVDFWYADATALPFTAGLADGALSLNVLDAVQWPLLHLHELARVLAPGGRAVLASPYEWTHGVTPLEGWLGGHSQRGPLGGSSAAELRRLLARDGRPAGAPALAIDAERDNVSWTMSMHERARVTYRLDMVRVRPAAP
jgi:SAM-dependent methyltransferase